MLRLGLTGGIGSGKTTVARIFETLGIPVYYADDAAKKLMNESEVIRQQLIRHFGGETYLNGTLNRPFLASQVFSDPQKLELLNSITHPPTIEHANQWMKRFEGQSIPYTIKEAALLFESGSVRHLDYVIGVHAPVTLRIHRIMKRDGIASTEVKNRMDRQLDESIKMKLCDFVIDNNDQDMLIPQVIELHNRLVSLPAKLTA